jgi:multicomponent Na+:H+ antiporter subunit C
MSWYLTGALFLVGVWGLLTKAHLIKKIFALGYMNSAIVLLFVLHAADSGGDAPILTATSGEPVDPLPHALMLTAIVVGICVIAFALALAYRLYKRFGTLDIRRIEDEAFGETEE